MMARANQRGDSVLKLVMFDRYRKFIKMAQGITHLVIFLLRFTEDPGKCELTLMRAFVGNLRNRPVLKMEWMWPIRMQVSWKRISRLQKKCCRM